MATIPELKAELQEAKFQLRYRRPVDWSNPRGGAVDFHSRLIKVERLQVELNRALKAEAGV